MRILAIAPTSFFADYGCHVRILQQVLALQAQGHEVQLLTYPSGRDVPEVELSRAGGLPGTDGLQIGPRPAKFPLDLSLAAHSLRFARRWKPNLVLGYLHEGASIGWLVARSLGVPLAFDFQGSLAGELAEHGWVKPTGALYGTVRGVERWIHRRADLILCSSQHAALALQNQYEGQDVRPLPDCVDTALFDPERLSVEDRLALKERLGIPAERNVVVYLGLLGQHQGIPQLLRAAATWPDNGPAVHFLVMGYPNVDGYEKLARELNVTERVTFTGKVPYEDAPMYLSLGDVAVAPKGSDSQGHGKLLNYMAMRLPTVAFDTPVNREYLGELGVYAPQGCAEVLAWHLAALLLSSDREAIGRLLRERAQAKFSCQRLGAMLEAALLSLLPVSALAESEAAG